ncbi:MAG: hypothetical protein Q9217_003613 [Psora testacea]
MSRGEVIDLLSSDDETISRLDTAPKKSIVSALTTTTYFRSLANDSEGIAPLDEEWVALPTKTRELSPSLDDASLRLAPASSKGTAKHTLSNLSANNLAETENAWADAEEADPIDVTSSAHYPSNVSRTVKGPIDADSVKSDESDDSLPDNILSFAPCHRSHANLSERTAALIASLAETVPQPKPRKLSAQQTRKRDLVTLSQDAVNGISSGESDNDISTKGRSSRAKKYKLPEEERDARAREKQKAKEARAREKDLRREQKVKEKEQENGRRRLLREDKAKERRIAAELAEVNKSKLDKRDSTPEMIVDLPASMDGFSVDTQVREFLKNLGVDATLYQSKIPGVVKWRRKIKAKWNAELDHWEPLDHMIIEDEKHIMCLMSAKDFVSIAMEQNEGEDVETHVAKLKSAHEGSIPIYLIEGFHIWMRKNKTAENRAYQAKVLGQAQVDGETSAQPPKRKRLRPDHVDEDMIEDALLRLQVMNGCLVHHTNTPLESAEWIANFTQHISTIPYRQQKMNLSTTFCMESGQVKTGEDTDDTFVKMLQEIVRVTPPIAFGIASAYPGVVKLVNAFRKHGPLVLEDLQKSANRNGAVTDRKIGPAISRRLYKVFMEQDPASTDV